MLMFLRKMRVSSQKGFTLIELMVVIAIIGILPAIAVPQYTKQRTRAQNVQALSDLRNVKLDLESFYPDHMEYPN